MSGYRANGGPPPNPNALRRDRDSSTWVTLPAERTGPAPVWPLSEPSEREVALWVDAWTRPQAVMWEQNHQQIEVALYVRRLSEAEVPGSGVTLSTLVKQQQEALGLSLPGMLRQRWKIDPAAEPAATPDTAPPPPPAPGVGRRRLVVVDAVARS